LKTRVTYIVSNVNKALAFEWIVRFIDKEQFELHFILMNPGDSDLEKFLRDNGIKTDRVVYNGKKDIFRSIIRISRLLRENKSTVVHTHLFDANIAGLTAAKLAGIKKRIHTRHHSSYHHLYHPQAIRYDRYINRLSTDIIAISGVVKDLLIEKEQVPEKKIHLIHHGFLLEEFEEAGKKENPLAAKYNPGNAHPVIGVISRFTEWKGIQYIIPAFRQLLVTYPDALLIMANAKGEYENELRKLLSGIPEKNYLMIPFENQVAQLYRLFDVFVHVPVTPDVEAFGQTYVEALASDIPSVFTLSGIAHEFIRDGHNAVVVKHQSSEEIHAAMLKILHNSAFASRLISNGKIDVNNSFGLAKMMLSLELLYHG
jgi:glycosyltransferase involved in cell wall biosynthesis